MTEPVRVAVVGAGNWGAQHARAFSEHPQSELVGIYSRRLERAQSRAARWHTEGFDDLDRMIEGTRPDLISVCLPNTEHYDLTIRVIRTEIPLLVEKPLVFDPAEGAKLIDEANSRDLFFAINFNHRYATPVQLAKKDLEDGNLGELSFLSWRFGGEGSSRHHRYANLIESQCHGLDMLEYLGGPIATVSCEMTDRPGDGAHSTLAVALRFASGAVGTLLGSYDSSYAYPGTQLIEVNGDRGRAVIEDTVKRYSFSQAGDATRRVWEAGYFDDRSRSFERTFDAHLDVLLAALQSGGPPPVPASAGLRALTISWSIIQSHQSGKRIAVPIT